MVAKIRQCLVTIGTIDKVCHDKKMEITENFILKLATLDAKTLILKEQMFQSIEEVINGTESDGTGATHLLNSDGTSLPRPINGTGATHLLNSDGTFLPRPIK